MDEMTPTTRINLDDERYFHDATVTDTTSSPLRIPAVGRDAAVSVTPGTDAKVQFTVSNYDDIETDNAVWEDWPSGEITAAKSDVITGAASALRLVSTGASTWSVSV